MALFRYDDTTVAEPASELRPQGEVSEVVLLQRYYVYCSNGWGQPERPPFLDRRGIVLVRKAYSKLLKQGWTYLQLLHFTDLFFQLDSVRKSPLPHFLLQHKGIQAGLLRMLEGEADLRNEVLQWVADDFERTQELPWPEEEHDARRKLLLANGYPSLYTYPEVVLDLMEDPEAVEAFNDILVHFMGGGSLDDLCETNRAALAALPEEVVRNNPRQPAATLAEAVRRAQG